MRVIFTYPDPSHVGAVVEVISGLPGRGENLKANFAEARHEAIASTGVGEEGSRHGAGSHANPEDISLERLLELAQRVLTEPGFTRPIKNKNPAGGFVPSRRAASFQLDPVSVTSWSPSLRGYSTISLNGCLLDVIQPREFRREVIVPLRFDDARIGPLSSWRHVAVRVVEALHHIHA